MLAENAAIDSAELANLHRLDFSEEQVREVAAGIVAGTKAFTKIVQDME